MDMGKGERSLWTWVRGEVCMDMVRYLPSLCSSN